MNCHIFFHTILPSYVSKERQLFNFTLLLTITLSVDLSHQYGGLSNQLSFRVAAAVAIFVINMDLRMIAPW